METSSAFVKPCRLPGIVRGSGNRKPQYTPELTSLHPRFPGFSAQPQNSDQDAMCRRRSTSPSERGIRASQVATSSIPSEGLGAFCFKRPSARRLGSWVSQKAGGLMAGRWEHLSFGNRRALHIISTAEEKHLGQYH